MSVSRFCVINNSTVIDFLISNSVVTNLFISQSFLLFAPIMFKFGLLIIFLNIVGYFATTFVFIKLASEPVWINMSKITLFIIVFKINKVELFSFILLIFSDWRNDFGFSYKQVWMYFFGMCLLKNFNH